MMVLCKLTIKKGMRKVWTFLSEILVTFSELEM